jgi:hypothetical protein
MKLYFPPIAAMAALLSIFTVGCNDDSSPTSPTVSTPGPTSGGSESPAGTVKIRVAHLSPDAPAVDVRVEGELVLTNVPFQTVSDYLELEAGEYRIQVTPAGAAAPAVIDATVPLSAGSVYTVAAVGFVSSNSLEPLVLLDDLAVASGARIRFVHASPDTGGVDIAVSGGPVLFEGVTYLESSDYVEVPSGTYDLEARPAGSSTVALSIPGVQVASGTTYTVFAVGRSFDGSLAALPIVDAP